MELGELGAKRDEAVPGRLLTDEVGEEQPQVWGAHGTCDLDAIEPVVRPFFPGDDPAAPPPDLGASRALEGLAEAAGLSPREAYEVRWAYEYADEAELLRRMLAAGGVGAAAGDREDDLRAALLQVLSPFRTSDGGYRLENQWHTLVASA
jgi:hypothetical protein